MRDPAQLTGALVGLFVGWAIALTILSNALLYKPFAIVAGVLGGMLIGWAIWLATTLSLFLAGQSQ